MRHDRLELASELRLNKCNWLELLVLGASNDVAVAHQILMYARVLKNMVK